MGLAGAIPYQETMTTLFKHAFVGGSLVYFIPKGHRTFKNYALAALIGAAPDLDVISFHYGVPYGSLFGHRGITHSLLFALILGILGFLLSINFRLKRVRGNELILLPTLILAAFSHGVLDALTNGGKGVAFFAPFVETRYFFPIHPIDVCKIGANFFHSLPRLITVLKSELLYVWLPCLMLMSLTFCARYKQKLEKNNDAILFAD